jgi:general secretion pathway protein I
MNMLSYQKKSSRGFTLLELLVAMAILTIVAVTALNNNSTMIANTTYLKKKTLAHWVTMNKAAELRLAGRRLNQKGLHGVAVMAGQRWHWQATGKETPDPDIQMINIEVREEEGRSSPPLTSLVMYLGRTSEYKIN